MTRNQNVGSVGSGEMRQSTLPSPLAVSDVSHNQWDVAEHDGLIEETTFGPAFRSHRKSDSAVQCGR